MSFKVGALVVVVAKYPDIVGRVVSRNHMTYKVRDEAGEVKDCCEHWLLPLREEHGFTSAEYKAKQK